MSGWEKFSEELRDGLPRPDLVGVKTRELQMRADVREATIEAAAAERFANGCYVVLVSEVIVEELRGKWSPPVQITIATEGWMAEMTVREVSNQESSRDD